MTIILQTFLDFSKNILQKFFYSESSVLVSKTICAVDPLLINVSNAELASSQGVDILLLNMFDVNSSIMNGLLKQTAPAEALIKLSKLTDVNPRLVHNYSVK